LHHESGLQNLGLPGNAYRDIAPEGGMVNNVIPAKAGIQEGWPSVTKQFFVYIMASRRNGTIYVGVTSNLVQRVWRHQDDVVEGFTNNTALKCSFISNRTKLLNLPLPVKSSSKNGKEPGR